MGSNIQGPTIWKLNVFQEIFKNINFCIVVRAPIFCLRVLARHWLEVV